MSKFKYLVLSDIHLGHNINRTDNIIYNLRRFFQDHYKVLRDINAIFLAGDVFDRLLSPSSQDFILINQWLTELLILCKNNDIMLRILEGTHSHDWKQAKVLSAIISKLEIELDYKYIDDIYIEKNKKYNISILYVPDDYDPIAKNTYKRVLEVLNENHLSNVDIAIMHDQFHYQMPNIILDSSHTESDYLEIVKYYISIGHIHTHSFNGRILAQGSFDRLAHNEEEDKGGIVITLDKEKESSWLFLKNKHAMIFNTYYFKNVSLEDIILRIDKEVKKLPEGSSVRLICDNPNIDIISIRKKYPMLRFKLERKVKQKEKHTIIDKDLVIEEFNITKENISELLFKELTKYNLTGKELEMIESEISNVI